MKHTKLGFQTSRLGEPFVPSALQVPRDQTILRIDDVILSMRARRLVSSLLNGQLLLPKGIGADPLAIGDRRYSRIKAQRRDRPQHLRRNRRVDAHVSKGDTIAAPRMINVGVIAHVSGNAT